jgi:hypothetical protein
MDIHLLVEMLLVLMPALLLVYIRSFAGHSKAAKNAS